MHTHKCRVLLVDDHDAVRDQLRALLSRHEDVQVIAEARDGEEAIIRVASCQPDIIVMDISMPRMDGIQATTVIKKSRKKIAIIGLSQVQDRYAIEAFLKAGGVAVVSKERFDHLYSIIDRACEGRRSSGPGSSSGEGRS